MSETKWTPGPWRFLAGEDNTGNDADCTLGAIVGGPRDLHLARIWSDVGVATANANLIAAAPDLYAALETAAAFLAEVFGHASAPYNAGAHQTLKLARAALAKARGES